MISYIWARNKITNMQFKHPELLWALLLLFIPIIVHLFQLRRFEKVSFTNVKYLKFVELQTRKSSQLKKWLTLLTRLLLLACIVIAFAQPFTSNTEGFNIKNEIVIYLDNSFSMEAKGNNGSLLNEAIQDMIKTIPEDDEITVFTNDDTYRNTSIKAISNKLIQLKYSPQQLSYKSAYLKGKQFFSEDKASIKHLILISDFQQKKDPLNFETDSSIVLQLVQPKTKYANNISLDSVYIDGNTSGNIELKVKLSQQGSPIENVSVSLFNDETLIAKTAVDIDNETTTAFSIPSDTSFRARVAIEDASLQYDNILYFNINDTEKIKVLSINQTSDRFLEKLYTEDEFVFSSFDLKDLSYNRFEAQNLIILNELETIPNALITALNVFASNGGSILIIPSENIQLNSYNQLLNILNLPNLNPTQNIEKRVTSINYDHPLLESAFYNRVDNFQYPKVNSFYPLASPYNAVYNFEDGQAFLTGGNKTYVFTAALNSENTNFKKSPLIVPVLYNLGKQSLELPQLYYNVGDNNTIDINVAIGQDDILNLENDKESLIPLQQTFSKKVSLTTNDYPKSAGLFNVTNDQRILNQLSFNYNRSESNLSYYNISDNANFSADNSFTSTFDAIKSNTRINALWKWFVIFALAFLIIEVLILKYLK